MHTFLSSVQVTTFFGSTSHLLALQTSAPLQRFLLLPAHSPSFLHWQVFAPALHEPPAHASLSVQASPSVQVAVLFFFWQPSFASQLSSVQGLLSSQTTAAPTHAPLPSQVSDEVHTEPSSHGFFVRIFAPQPVATSHGSSVQGLPSSQFSLLPAHLPSLSQLSFSVQALPSVQVLPTSGLNAQSPVDLSQVSAVQALLSSHSFGVPTHLPAAQRSLIEQGTPSSQGDVFWVNTQPVFVSQLSSVHALPSWHDFFSPTHFPPRHASFSLHASPSSQAFVKLVLVQPEVGSQASAVQALVSSQSSFLPLHTPASHVSPVVQAVPSSQEPVFSFLLSQPALGSHESTVHGLASSQSLVTPAHRLAAHVSSLVQASASSQLAVLLVVVQPAERSHESSVQGLLSSQTTVAPAHRPTAQPSSLVHASPSSQAFVLLVLVQPAAMSQASSVQGLLSSQETVTPVQRPTWQVSPFVHALPSSQLVASSLLWTQPLPPSQVSAVQPLPSSQPLAPSSSVAPSQLLSMPSQVSFSGALVVQAPSPPPVGAPAAPSAKHCRVLVHPGSPAAKHVVFAAVAMA